MTVCLRWPAGGDGYAACSWEFENFSDWKTGRSGSGGRRDVHILDMKFKVAGCNYGECESECSEGCEER